MVATSVKQYAMVTGNYWAFTITDGALRMLIVLHFYALGYSAFEIAMLFVLYEICGVFSNLFGGWFGARVGLNRTMNIGLALQVVSLLMLCVPNQWLSLGYVMLAQAFSGVAKDLNKMSAKSAIKGLVASNNEGKLFKWIALLTGSKNALKGVGFFVGALLLYAFGFRGALLAMAGVLSAVWLASVWYLQQDLGKAKNKPKFSEVFSKSRAINLLSAARLFLFASRDVWFVVALPLYLSEQFDWSHQWVGGFLAIWVIGYGFVQSVTPNLVDRDALAHSPAKVGGWAFALACLMTLICISVASVWWQPYALVVGLLAFGVVFAINSSIHSYMIVSFADADAVSLDVGFYYMANAIGRLVGTILSGVVYQFYGVAACLAIAAAFALIAGVISMSLPNNSNTLADIGKAPN